MRILITGATGFLGRHIVKALAGERHDLVLTSRKGGEGADDLHKWHKIDFATALDPKDWHKIVENVDLIINAVGIFSPTGRQSFSALHDQAPRALFAAGERAGVRRIIQISALGTDETAVSAYHLSKKKADDVLAQSGVEWVILRPSLVIGDAECGEGVSWRFFKALALLPLVPVIGDGRQPLQPVPVSQLVRAVRRAMHGRGVVGQRINIVGADCLTLETYLQKLSRWQGRLRFRPLHIPYGLARILATGSRLFGDLPLNREAIEMLRQARKYEGADCRQKLGFRPTGLESFLAQNPVRRDGLMASRQFFLRPLLRYALAFMWIAAGLASAFLHPFEQSALLLAQLGFSKTMAGVALYGASALDVLMGMTLLFNFRLSLMGKIQIALILFYTMVLSFVTPFMWADPFGALAKNVPIIVATMVLLSFEE